MCGLKYQTGNGVLLIKTFSDCGYESCPYIIMAIVRQKSQLFDSFLGESKGRTGFLGFHSVPFFSEIHRSVGTPPDSSLKTLCSCNWDLISRLFHYLLSFQSNWISLWHHFHTLSGTPDSLFLIILPGKNRELFFLYLHLFKHCFRFLFTIKIN